MPTNEETQKRAEELLALSREDLLRKLTEDRDPGFVGDLLREGKRLYERTAKNQRKTICTDARVQAAFRDPAGNRRVLIVCAIADALGTAGALTIAVLIVQDGLESYCEAIWKTDGK